MKASHRDKYNLKIVKKKKNHKVHLDKYKNVTSKKLK